MNRKKPEQIVKLLRKTEEEPAKGKQVEDFCREEQISPATYYRWQRKYGGLARGRRETALPPRRGHNVPSIPIMSGYTMSSLTAWQMGVPSKP